MTRQTLSWVAALLFVPGLAVAQAVDGFQTAVAVRAGSQTDPHISGTVISYTDTDGTTSAIHLHDLAVAGGNDTVVDPGAGIDLLSDISGNLIAYTHIEAGSRSIRVYNATTGEVTVINDQVGSDRRDVAVGGNTIAWVDYSGASPDVFVYDLVTGPSTGPVQISFGAAEDTDLAVSPDGSRVVYSSCSGGFNGCDIVVYDTASGTSTTVTGSATEDRSPDVSNDRVVYAETDAPGDTDIVWVGFGGGSSGRFDRPGAQFNPSIAGDLIAFEGFSPDNSGRDIYVLDVTPDELYRLTNTLLDEVLNDISVSADGLIRVTWSTNTGLGEEDVYAFTFSRRVPPVCEAPTAAQACADPTGRPLLAELSLTRGHGTPAVADTDFSAITGTAGVVCIDTSGTTAGWVLVNRESVARPNAFGPDVTSIAEAIDLDGANTLWAAIAGRPGSSYTVKVYGARAGCVD